MRSLLRLWDYCRWSAKLPHFPCPNGLPLYIEFWITGYYHPGRFQHAGSQETDLSCHVAISTFCCTVITICQRYRRTDGRHARSIGTIWHVNGESRNHELNKSVNPQLIVPGLRILSRQSCWFTSLAVYNDAIYKPTIDRRLPCTASQQICTATEASDLLRSDVTSSLIYLCWKGTLNTN